MNKLLLILSISILSLTGCSFVNVDVRGTEVAYKYKTDIYDADRYNPGSDYFTKLPFEVSPRILYVDYGIQTIPFEATYTLPTEQKISISVAAEILFRLKRNPLDKDNELKFKDDEHIQYFSKSVSPDVESSRDYALFLSPVSLWNKAMAEPTDLAFRSVFTDSIKYDSFDRVESSIVEIQKYIKTELTTQASKHYIEVVGVKIKDIPVPLEISTSRGKNLKLIQESINQVQELQILANNAAMQMAVDVRYAMNSVIVDKLVNSRTDKGYKLLEILRKGAENGNAMQVNITPDFMRYLENDPTTKDTTDNKMSDELFDSLYKMTDEELIKYFTTTNTGVK